MIGFRAEINENAFCALRNEDYHSGDRNCHRHQRSIGLNHCRFQLHEVSMATATASHFVSETRVPLRNFHHPIVVCTKRLDIDSTPTPPHPPSPQCMHIAQWPHLDSRTFSGWKTAKPFKFGESFQIFIVSWNCSSDMADGHFYVASKRRQPGPLPPRPPRKYLRSEFQHLPLSAPHQLCLCWKRHQLKALAIFQKDTSVGMVCIA